MNSSKAWLPCLNANNTVASNRKPRALLFVLPAGCDENLGLAALVESHCVEERRLAGAVLPVRNGHEVQASGVDRGLRVATRKVSLALGDPIHLAKFNAI